MEIHQLEYFLAVEKYKNFSAASLEISISQSTLSQQIKKLEEELGVKLFVRHPRSVRLTPAGEEFLVHARTIVAEIKQSLETVQKYTNFDKGNFKIGAFPHAEYLGLSKIIIDFIRCYPGIHVEVHSASTDDLLKELREKKIQAAFINSPFTGDYDIDFKPLMSDRVVMVVSASHPLAKEESVDLHDLSQENFLMVKTSPWLRNALLHVCSEAGFQPKIILDCSHVETMRGFLEEGLGVTLLGSRVAQRFVNSKTSIVPIKQVLERHSGLAIPKYPFSKPPLATNLFRKFTLDALSKAPK
ncbi:LysR family transcriptional regulator [Paenibacillus validus]|uniref:LysR family transcriptional regulator n=1 Tax=Paenibacillus validus TaxID=44253 RepID=UPI000FD973DE|nr:LysR family transcriptional regulator [Paenibacillus validus]MED4599434.1 LysR family transcriptional regulator [Paenibacillus validus]MED4605146.1 LysR family transcriptional regulator [Paenibacillus validus]